MAVRARIAMVGATAGLALLLLTWYATFHVGMVERADQSIYRSVAALGLRPHVNSIATVIARLFDPKPYVFFCAPPVLVAIGRRRLWLASAIVAILIGANVTTLLLKPLLAHPRAANLLGGLSPPAAASWPSGHATAAMSFALCCLLAAPARLRPFVAAASAAFAVAISASALKVLRHYPSDILGGFLVAGIWTLLGVAVVLLTGARRPHLDAPEPPTRAHPEPRSDYLCDASSSSSSGLVN